MNARQTVRAAAALREALTQGVSLAGALELLDNAYGGDFIQRDVAGGVEVVCVSECGTTHYICTVPANG